jgi:hypothetical protein
MLRGKRARLRSFDAPLAARSRALHYLTNNNYKLSADVRHQLIEVVNGYIGLGDEAAARKGIEWMREQYREAGQTPRF